MKMKKIRAHRLYAHTMYLNCWSSCDDERRAVMAHALLVVGYGKPPTVSLSPPRRRQSFSRSPLFFFSEDVYILACLLSLLLFTSQQETTFSFSLFFSFFCAVRSFVQSERAREEKRHKTTTTQTKDERSLRAR